MAISTLPAAPASATAHRLGLLLVVLATLTWSSAGWFTRLIPLDAWTLLFWRGVFGALTGFLFILWRERAGTLRAFTGLGLAGWRYALLTALSMMAFLLALRTTTVAHVAIIYATVPFVAAGLAWLLLRERTTIATVLASLAALVGVGLTVMGDTGSGSPLGDGLAVLMTLLIAGMIVDRRAGSAAPAIPAACLGAALTALASLPMARPLTPSAVDMLHLALFGLTNMGFGLILFTLGARLIPASQSALITALDAPLAPIWVWLAFDEVPGMPAILGGIVVTLAVLGNVLADLRRAPPSC